MRILAPFVVVALLGSASLFGCGKVQMPHEVPGPPGCGLKDPSNTGPSMLSVAQQMTFKDHGPPRELQVNDKGGKTWIYMRATGGQFGERETIEMYEFDARGLLVGKKTDVMKNVGK